MSLPVFVYGTLRRGGRNEHRLEGRTRRPARLPDHALYELGGLPYCAPRPGSEVVGEVVVPDPERYEETLATLDRLEEGAYRRVVREVEARGGPLDAWVYVAREAVAARLEHRVAGGDWMGAEGGVPDGD